MLIRKERSKKPSNTTNLDLGDFILKELRDDLLHTVQERERFQQRDFHKYRNRPEAFIKEVLKEEFLTEDQKKVLRSVVENPITVLESANGVGKSFIMPRIGVFFYKVYNGCQVYMAAAPPEDNLKRILGGELGNIVAKNPGLFLDDKVSLSSMEIKRSALEFISGVTIPQSGDEAAKKARFCVDAEDIFEKLDGSHVLYKDLVGIKSLPVKSVNKWFEIEDSIAEFYDNGEEEIFEITTQDGKVYRRTANHPLFTGSMSKPQNLKYLSQRYRVVPRGWTPVEKLKRGDLLLCPQSTEFNFGNLIENEDVVKVLAYLIGDGGLTQKSPRFYQQKNKQLDELRACVEALGCRLNGEGINYAYSIVGDGDLNIVTKFVEKYNLRGKNANNKTLGELKNLEKPLMALFLSRLFSTDGCACVKKNRKYNVAEISYTSNSEVLVREIQLILQRFGIRGTVRKKRTTWVLEIHRKADIISFAEQIGIYGKEEKVNQCLEVLKDITPFGAWRKAGIPGFAWERVASVKSIGVRPTVCVTVPGNETYLTSLVEHNSGKHSPVLIFLIDEGDALPKSIYEAIESCMSGGFARLVISYNPRSKTNPVYQMARSGNANVIKLSAFNHPNVICGKNLVPGAVTREATCRRIAEWTRPLIRGESLENTFEVPTFLVGVQPLKNDGVSYLPKITTGRRKIIQPEFSYMVLGEASSMADNQLIDREWCVQAMERYKIWTLVHGMVPPVAVSTIMGLDVAEFGKDFSVATFRTGGFVRPQIVWGGVNVTETSYVAEKHFLENQCESVFVDSNGLGAGVWSNLISRNINAHRIMVQGSPTKLADMEGEILGEFDRIRDQMWWNVREWLRTDPNAMLPTGESEEQYGLIDQLCSATYKRATGTNRIKICGNEVMEEKLNGKSPDHATSLALTFAPIPSEEGTGELDSSNYLY